MDMAAQTERLWGLAEDDSVHVHTGSDGSTLTVQRGEKVEKYSYFDIKIRLEGGRYGSDDPPSHPEVFSDLHQKIEAGSGEAARLFEIIELVYEGHDPDEYSTELEAMSFAGGKFPADVTVYLLQQMMIEQEINYGPGGSWTRFNPPRDLLMSCVRWIFSGEYEEIDEVISAGYAGRTPTQYQFDGDDIWTRPEY